MESLALIDAWFTADGALIQVYLERLELCTVVHRNVVLLVTLLVVKSLMELLADDRGIALDLAYAAVSKMIYERVGKMLELSPNPEACPEETGDPLDLSSHVDGKMAATSCALTSFPREGASSLPSQPSS